MRWQIPQSETDLLAWIGSLDERDLDAFVQDCDYILDGPDSGDQHLVLATIAGAARKWRNEGISPLETLRATAPAGFYEDET